MSIGGRLVRCSHVSTQNWAQQKPMKHRTSLAISVATVVATTILGSRALHSPNAATASTGSETAKSQFALLFHEPTTQFASRTNEKATQYWKTWTDYIGGIQKSGSMISGSALTDPKEATRIGKAPKPNGTDLGGFVIIEANSAKEALEVAKASPAIPEGGYVEVRPVLPMAEHHGDVR